MIQLPRLKTYLTVFPISPSCWGLKGGSEELWRIQLRDEQAIRTLGALLPFLDGQTATDQILASLAEQGIDRGAAHQLLDNLEKSSLIEEADVGELDVEELERYADQLSFFSRFSTAGGARLQQRLKEAHVAVVGNGRLAQRLSADLLEAGVGEVTALVPDPAAAREPHHLHGLRSLRLDRRTLWPAEADLKLPRLMVLPQESHDLELLEAMDEVSRGRSLPWLLLRGDDPHEGWVGPLFIPGDTASFRSLEARFRGNLEHLGEYLAFDQQVRENGAHRARVGSLMASFAILSGLAVTEIVKLITGYAIPQLAGRFVTLNYGSWEAETHEVLRVPHLENGVESRPPIFPWKEVPYGDKKTRRA